MVMLHCMIKLRPDLESTHQPVQIGSSGGRGVLPFRIGRTWFKLAVTSSKQFLPVVVHDK